ncbi:hypothetical protein GCM10027085_13630 [Spirosoma aerophilum]
MTRHTFLWQDSPQYTAVPRFCQPGFLFNEPPHLYQQNDGRVSVLSAINGETQQADVRYAFFVQDGQAVSPLAAPFGSIEFSESVSDTVLSAFVHTLTEAVRGAGARALTLVNYPTCYAPQQTEQLMRVLAKHGFHVTESHPNFFLPIHKQPFVSQLIPAERRRLRKCRDAGFVFTHGQTLSSQSVVDFIRHTRCQLGYPLTIQPERLINLLTRFQDSFSVFTVHDGTQLAALTVTVRVRHDILYNLLPASASAYRSFSPMVMLVDGLFSYCQQENIRLLDLGVSLDANGQPKPSLMRFKRNLGSRESSKLTFGKAL